MTQVRRSAALLGGLWLVASPVGISPAGAAPVAAVAAAPVQGAPVQGAPVQAAARRSPFVVADRPVLELAAGPAVRTQVGFRLDAPSRARPAWHRFRSAWGERWDATWDRATGVPSRLWGPGIAWPGATASPMVAAAYARAFLAQHVELLAPGASADDFQLVANDYEAGMRTLGFVQTHRGLRVLGGQISFRIKRDRLFVIGSEALPRVDAAPPTQRAAAAKLGDAARAWVEADIGAPARLVPAAGATAGSSAAATPATLVLPLVDDAGVRAYRTVSRVVVATDRPVGKWAVYLDAASGEVVAREQLLHFASGQLLYDTPDRHPGGSRTERPASRARVLLNNVAATTDSNGMLNWGSEVPGDVAVEARATGDLVDVVNSIAPPSTALLALAADGSTIWSGEVDLNIEAQVTGFVHANRVKEYARRFFAPELDYLDHLLTVTVNINDRCNAFSDGDAINFFHATEECQNTGTMPDVVYHEFGHSIHAHSIIEGVGYFDGAFSEGLSDYLAATITGDPGMGRGFFYDDEPLRNIDPADHEDSWPEDIGEIHTTGKIFAGSMWDLRKALVARLGDDDGVRLSDRLWYAAVRRAANIPTTYVEILAADDDDGDLSNGTPDECDIRTAFSHHGLRPLGAILDAPGQLVAADTGIPISLRFTGLSDRCPDSDGVQGVSIDWRSRGTEAFETGALALADGLYTFALPRPASDGVVQYRLRILFNDGTERTLPDNPSDRWYEVYVGEVVPLYCDDFESDPFAAGWSHGVTDPAGDATHDQWEWGIPTASSSGDPGVAYSGDRVVGQNLHDLGRNSGYYQADTTSFLLSPSIDVDSYSDIHLQYRRWLNVEDGYYDKASIKIDGEVAWQQVNSNQGDNGSTLHHMDGEWRFHDVPLSAHISKPSFQVAFELDSDGGLEMGGWTIDDVCVVANPASICGDGTVTGGEQCDDGDSNAEAPDACRTNCRQAICGDTIIDTGEECDDGNGVGSDECRNDCLRPIEVGGCCDAGGSPWRALPLPLLLAALGLLGLRGLGARRGRGGLRRSCARSPARSRRSGSAPGR